MKLCHLPALVFSVQNARNLIEDVDGTPRIIVQNLCEIIVFPQFIIIGIFVPAVPAMLIFVNT